MITLINRADGTPLTSLSPEDFVVFQDHLVLESEQDFDYYLNPPTLEMLAEAGLSSEVTEALRVAMRDRGLDVGWEHPQPGACNYSGSVVDDGGLPLGGIRLDLVQGRLILAWAYSRQDGTFVLSGNPGDEPLVLRFSGRGDLVLREVEVENEGDLGTFELQTLSGFVHDDEGAPLAGVNVLLTDWGSAEWGRDTTSWVALGGRRSWGDSDESGRFAIPVSLPEHLGRLEVSLELTGLGGESLGQATVTFDPSEGLEVGSVIARPQRDEGEASAFGT